MNTCPVAKGPAGQRVCDYFVAMDRDTFAKASIGQRACDYFVAMDRDKVSKASTGQQICDQFIIKVGGSLTLNCKSCFIQFKTLINSPETTTLAWFRISTRLECGLVSL